jgi:hypothetical protein
VFRSDGSITAAFEEFCKIKAELDANPVLNEQDYDEMEYEATLENYRGEMWRERDLPEAWEAEVYSWFNDHDMERFTDNEDDQGGWAPREKIVEALQALGLMPTVVVREREIEKE